MKKLPAWIVFVDDEEPVRRAFGRLMRAENIRACAYASGAEFMSSLPEGMPDCVVLDVNMPGMNGFEVQARLAVEAPELPVILVTGHDTSETRDRALQTRAVAYLQKPFDAQLLLDALQAATQQRSPPGQTNLGIEGN